MVRLSYASGIILATTLTAGLVATSAASAEPVPRVNDQSGSQLASPEADAALAKPNCKHRAAAHGVRDYWRKRLGHGSAPLQAVLRCGTEKWGYRHFNKRWSQGFEVKMGNTLAKPNVIIQLGNKLIYCRKYGISKKKFYFKVVYSIGDVPGSNTGDLGIITATWDKKGGKCDDAT